MAARNYLVVQGLISNINTYIFLYQLQLVFKPLSCIESLHIEENNSLQNWNTTKSWHEEQNAWFLTGPLLVYIISFGSLEHKSSALTYIHTYTHSVFTYTHTHTHTHTHTQCVYKWMVQFQKLTRNLFLTLHGHNIHRQQQQLSKFRMRYEQFAFHAYCGAAAPQ